MSDKPQTRKSTRKERRAAARAAMHPDIRRLLVIPMLAVVIGAVTTILGELVLANEKVKDVGFSMTLLAAGFYFFLRFLGRLKGGAVAEPTTDTGTEGGESESEAAAAGKDQER